MLIVRKLEERGINPRLALPVTLLLVVAVIAWILMATGKQVEPQATVTRPLPIDAFAVSEENIELRVYTQGTVEPRTQSELVAEVAGKVSWVAPQLVAGGAIEKGEALLKLDAADYQTELVRAKASFARREAEHQRTERERKRMAQLRKKNLVSQAQLDNAISEQSVAEANLAEAQANIGQAQRNIARTAVNAPYDGLVRSKAIDVGQYLSRGAKVASVYATDYLEVRLPIADAELAFIDRSKLALATESKPSVLLSAEYAGRQAQWHGVINRLEATIDTQSRMVYAVARLQTGQEQAPPVGLFVKAQVSGEIAESVIAIPRAALRDNNKVLIVNDDNILESRTVRILRSEGERLVLSEGLHNGDLVSVSLSTTLSPGSLVAATVINQSEEPRPDEASSDTATKNTER